MKKISIMITSYNLEDYIDTSIQSVIQQDMPCDWELLIGDDGSTDDTVVHINKWIEKYPNNIKLYQIPREEETKKVGSRAAKNRAFLLEQSTGDYLIYLDGDDCWLGTEKLIRQFAALESPEYANCSCCAHNIEAFVIPENRRYLMTDAKVSTRVFGFEEYWKRYYFHTNTILFRRVCKEKLLNPLYRDFLNDNFITYLVIQYGDILYMKDVWAQYNLTGQGLWTGHKRIYGLFRNMQIVDLQIKERSDAKSIIYYRHYNDLKSVISEYKEGEDYTAIEPLLQGTTPSDFPLTFMLSKESTVSSLDFKQLQTDLNRVYLHKLKDRVCTKIRKLISR